MITAKKALVHWHKVAPNIRQLLALGLWRPFTHCPASGTAGFIQRRAESSGTSNSSAAWVTLPPVHPALHQQETLPPTRKKRQPTIPPLPSLDTWILRRGQDRLHRAAGGRGQALLPVASAAVRQEPVPRDAEGAFPGNRELFAGLQAHVRWAWSVRHPMVRLSFGRGTSRGPATCARTWRRSWPRLSGARGRCAAGTRIPSGSPICSRPCMSGAGSGLPCWSTNTTSRSWTRWRRSRWRAPIGTTCWACTRRSRIATPMSASASSPG